MSVLELLERAQAERAHRLRSSDIGADLIPRSALDDPQLAGVDLIRRGQDRVALAAGISRVESLLDSLPAELDEAARRTGTALQEAGPEEIGRWATDVVLAYARVPHLRATTEAAVYLAWSIALGGEARGGEELI